MPVEFICPACGAAGSARTLAPTVCAICKAPLPDALRVTLAASLAREQVPMPALLQIGRFGSVFMGGIMTLLLFLAPFDIGTYNVNDESASGPEFLRRVGVGWALMSFTLLAVGYALWTEKWWGRWAMVGYWAALGAMVFALEREDPAQMFSGVVSMLIAVGIAGWYLFGKENVVRYYKELERRADTAEGTPPPGATGTT